MFEKLRWLGPGLLLAGAAIGGSHLVASTTAGATYGWSLLGIMLLVNLFKYPFFMYSQKYTAATGNTILDGYYRLGKGYHLLFFILILLTSTINIAGVTMITGSLAMNFGINNASVPLLTAAVMVICLATIVLGGFRGLRSFGRIVVTVLAFSTIAAMIIGFSKGAVAEPGFVGESPWTMASFGFVIIFMGWMPAPIDVSVWPSLWMKSQEITDKKSATMKEAMFDFNTGYIVSVVLAFVFMALGKLVLYGSGTAISSQGSVFARQLIDIYSATIGNWAGPIIIIAAFSAMFSTSITTIDGYPRSLATSFTIIFGSLKNNFKMVHAAWIVLSLGAAFLLVSRFVDSLGDMLALAMIISFLTAPVFAWLNYRVMCGDDVPNRYKPGKWLKTLSISGIVFLTGFSLTFIIWYFSTL